MESAVFEQDDYFKIDPEAHLVGDMKPLEHFPGVQMWWRAIHNIARPLMLGTPPEILEGIDPRDLEKNADPEALRDPPRRVVLVDPAAYNLPKGRVERVPQRRPTLPLDILDVRLGPPVRTLRATRESMS